MGVSISRLIATVCSQRRLKQAQNRPTGTEAIKQYCCHWGETAQTGLGPATLQVSVKHTRPGPLARGCSSLTSQDVFLASAKPQRRQVYTCNADLRDNPIAVTSVVKGGKVGVELSLSPPGHWLKSCSAHSGFIATINCSIYMKSDLGLYSNHIVEVLPDSVIEFKRQRSRISRDCIHVRHCICRLNFKWPLHFYHTIYYASAIPIE